MKFKKSLFIFRRDLRIEDNTALIKALETSEEVICCFIFNKKQISESNEYRSLNSMQFLKNSIKKLGTEFEKLNSHLYLFEDRIDNVISDLKNQEKIEAVFVNKDFLNFIF